jgi:ADP-ribosylglycohydrolase
MLGAIAGDIIGSPYERGTLKTTEFPLFSAGSRFTDDTVCTIALAELLIAGASIADTYTGFLHDYFWRYPDAGFGGAFFQWAKRRDPKPYGSYGNGSAMRVSPVGFAAGTWEEALQWARESAAVSHDHPEGIRGAQATAAAIFLAQHGETKPAIRARIERTFQYDLSPTLADLRPVYRFDVTCQGTVPPALIAFLEATDYESAVRNAVSLGGDSDTLACITGGIAHAYYGGVPETIAETALSYLDASQQSIVDAFGAMFNA